MADRREPQAREILRRIESEFAPHVLERIDRMITAELARTPDTERLVLELPDSHGAKIVIRGFPATVGQRLKRKLTG